MVVTWQDWVLCAAAYLARMFFITAGYHRYFSHRSYRMGRVTQFVMAFGGTTAVQKGPLWWAGHHRIHHRYTDLDDDVHSPRDGFWWSHVGWILSTKYKACDLSTIKDFAAYPELRFLERYSWIGPWLLAVGLLPHRRVGRPGDRVLPVHRAAVARHVPGQLHGPPHRSAPLRHPRHQPELDAHRPDHRRRGLAQQPPLPAGLVPPGLPLVGVRPHLVRARGCWPALHVVRDLKDPPARLLDQARVRDGAFDIGMFRSYWERAAKVTGERIADLSARPVAPSPEAQRPPVAPASADGADTRPVRPSRCRTSRGLISRVLESADQLAASTRRTRQGDRRWLRRSRRHPNPTE